MIKLGFSNQPLCKDALLANALHATPRDATGLSLLAPGKPYDDPGEGLAPVGERTPAVEAWKWNAFQVQAFIQGCFPLGVDPRRQPLSDYYHIWTYVL